jgi:hypothetical protein
MVVSLEFKNTFVEVFDVVIAIVVENAPAGGVVFDRFSARHQPYCTDPKVKIRKEGRAILFLVLARTKAKTKTHIW